MLRFWDSLQLGLRAAYQDIGHLIVIILAPDCMMLLSLAPDCIEIRGLFYKLSRLVITW
jgi:hypothetical protein